MLEESWCEGAECWSEGARENGASETGVFGDVVWWYGPVCQGATQERTLDFARRPECPRTPRLDGKILCHFEGNRKCVVSIVLKALDDEEIR